MDCCGEKPAELAGDRRVLLAEQPNSGKTSVFDALTGLPAESRQLAGVTVERKEGRCIDASALGRELGICVVKVDGRRRTGTRELAETALRAERPRRKTPLFPLSRETKARDTGNVVFPAAVRRG